MAARSGVCGRRKPMTRRRSAPAWASGSRARASTPGWLSTSARRKRCRGLSTIDVLAGSGLTLMTMGTVFAFSQAQLKALATQSSYAQSQNVTRTAIDLMTRELRMASLDPTNLALPVSTTLTCPGVKQGIVEATPARIHFRQDLNADDALTRPGAVVAYFLSEAQIGRTDGSAAPVAVVDSVPTGGLAFRYFDGSNP